MRSSCVMSRGCRFYALSTVAATSTNCPAYPSRATPKRVAGGTLPSNDSATAFQAAERLACSPTTYTTSWRTSEFEKPWTAQNRAEVAQALDSLGVGVIGSHEPSVRVVWHLARNK